MLLNLNKCSVIMRENARKRNKQKTFLFIIMCITFLIEEIYFYHAPFYIHIGILLLIGVVSIIIEENLPLRRIKNLSDKDYEMLKEDYEKKFQEDWRKINAR